MNRYLFLCVSVLFAAITVLPMTATASWQPEITIGLSQGVSEVRLSATSGALYVYNDPEKEPMMKIPQGQELSVRMIRDRFLANEKELKG